MSEIDACPLCRISYPGKHDCKAAIRGEIVARRVEGAAEGPRNGYEYAMAALYSAGAVPLPLCDVLAAVLVATEECERRPVLKDAKRLEATEDEAVAMLAGTAILELLRRRSRGAFSFRREG